MNNEVRNQKFLGYKTTKDVVSKIELQDYYNPYCENITPKILLSQILEKVKLTERQEKILNCIYQGLNLRFEIPKLIKTSYQTVYDDLKKIREKIERFLR